MLVEEAIQRAGDAADPLVDASAHVRPGVGDEPGHAELGAALQLIAKRRDRALPEGVVRGGQIDQIRIMGDDEANLAGGDPGAKALRRLWRDRLGVPLIRVLGENLARRHAERRGAFDSQRMTAGDRHMRAQQPHRPILHRSSFRRGAVATIPQTSSLPATVHRSPELPSRQAKGSRHSVPPVRWERGISPRW